MLTQSVHNLLFHSAELIEDNGEKGLMIYCEQGLEDNNKFLRQFRSNFARKTNQHANLIDCFNRLWIKSDPVISKSTRESVWKNCLSAKHAVRSCPEFWK